MNYTKGEWKIRGNQIFTIGTKTIATVHIQNNYEDVTKDIETQANLQAICSAVNNTYNKGINAEAVPELLEAVKDAYNYLITQNINVELTDRLASAINNTEIK